MWLNDIYVYVSSCVHPLLPLYYLFISRTSYFLITGPISLPPFLSLNTPFPFPTLPLLSHPILYLSYLYML